jgi:hypothetical protein
MQLRSKLFYSYLFFLIVYSCFTLLPAPSPIALAQYDLSAMGLRIIDATVIVLLAAIWFAGFYGYSKLRQYAQLISKERDGKHVAMLTRGIFLMVMWLPVSATVSAILNYVASHHLGLMPAVAIIENYLNLLLPLLGVVLIGIGARGLSDIVKQRPTHLANSILIVVLIYTGLIYYRLVGTTANRESVYHMSRWLVLLTIVAPYVFMWFTGVLATHEIFNYRQKVAGMVYRSSWKLLALGIGWLMVLSIAVQYLLTTLVSRLNHLSIYWILVIIYSLLLVYSVGFVLIALGARKLQKIEEV